MHKLTSDPAGKVQEQPLPLWYEEWLRQQTSDPTFNPDNSDDLNDRFDRFKSQLDRILGRFSATGMLTPRHREEPAAVPNKRISGLTQDMIALEQVIPHLIDFLDRSQAEDYAANNLDCR